METIGSVVELTWDDVLPIWRDVLWPGRISPIKQHSSMRYLGGYDMSVYSNPVHFWGLRSSDGSVTALTSGFKTSDHLYRSRSIWIHPSLRQRNITRILFDKTFETAKSQGCTAVWSFPRPSVISSYERYGFRQVSDWVMDGEFGPNCYVIKEI